MYTHVDKSIYTYIYTYVQNDYVYNQILYIYIKSNLAYIIQSYA